MLENDIVIGTSTKTETTNDANGANITKLTGQFKKIKSMKQLTAAVNAIQSYQPKDIHEKIVQRIYLYILEMHADRQWMFSKESIKTYSEADYQYKFWSYIFEQYLGRKQDVMLRCRGDTISESCKKIGKKFKLDLRLVLTPEEDIDLDSCTREMAKRATVKKIYKDKLKSTIATKCRLNSFVRAVPHIQARELPSVKMPILQVAGFQGQLSSILSQTSRQSKPTHLNSWLTKVVFEKEDDDSSSSDEDDDEEEEVELFQFLNSS
ncbi:hypothetical protein G6F42_021090 [Rhizopus arrhizus]|nr:hypothetical protein G6F42_021090 [Rhizopus arrhizus]